MLNSYIFKHRQTIKHSITKKDKYKMYSQIIYLILMHVITNYAIF